GDAKEVFASGDTSMAGDFPWWSLILTGIIYISDNLAVYSAALFTVERQKSMKDTAIAGLIAGVLLTVSWFLSYFAMMGHYPNDVIRGAEVLWLEMMIGFGFWVEVLFVIVG